MVIPRSWTGLQKQNTPWQTHHLARPTATGPREKAGAIVAAFAILIICFSLFHSLHHYHSSLWRKAPFKITISIALLATRVAYGIASSWNWDINISKVGVNVAWPFALGYAPILLIIITLEVAGFLDENQDKVLLGQRAARGRAADEQLRIVRKPGWWRGGERERYMDDEQRLRALMREGGAVAGREGDEIEMRDVGEDRERREDGFRDGKGSAEYVSTACEVGKDAEKKEKKEVRSMLDV